MPVLAYSGDNTKFTFAQVVGYNASSPTTHFACFIYQLGGYVVDYPPYTITIGCSVFADNLIKVEAANENSLSLELSYPDPNPPYLPIYYKVAGVAVLVI